MTRTVAVAFALALLAGSSAVADEIEVKMLNVGEKGPMVFEPDYVEAKTGDVIVFVPTDKGHDVASIDGMLPAGIEAFKSPFDVEYRLSVSQEGVYGVKCTPHYGMGMVALIKVGTPSNLETALAVRHPGRAEIVFEELLGRAGS